MQPSAVKQAILESAEMVDAWRLFPRLALFWFMAEVTRHGTWYMALEHREVGDHLVAAAVVGLGAAVFKFYVDSGRDWDRQGMAGQ